MRVNSLTFYLLLIVLPSCSDVREGLTQRETDIDHLSKDVQKPIKKSPLIRHAEWGKAIVEGFGEFEDVTLWPGGAKSWDYKRKLCPIMQEETKHYWSSINKDRAGIMPFEIRRLAKKGAKYIIVSRGMGNPEGTKEPMLEEATSLADYLSIKNLPKDLIESWNVGIDPENVLFLGTQEAVKRYNDLAEKGEPVGAIIHSTC